MQANSSDARLNHSDLFYDESALANTNGEIFAQQNANQPLYSNIRVELIR